MRACYWPDPEPLPHAALQKHNGPLRLQTAYSSSAYQAPLGSLARWHRCEGASCALFLLAHPPCSFWALACESSHSFAATCAAGSAPPFTSWLAVPSIPPGSSFV
ncbi:hypothetical protein P154DRAFT_568960 [Amniculicola lignicola CBS 123094]|uniref:Uncharacterized protein n=1 Tax=Amniculicola lignicola CBS 123094 TaxID=1392246 RepID=A0A6A5X5K5_9PLEO|nr:hypothetical protein P154DRAFT_568960 [Amniculicola lignicola CBS 123094]